MGCPASEEASEARKKIHRSGPYTGVLANGGTPLPRILRMAPGGGPNLIPGASVKFLIDGQPSRNFLAIHDFGGVPKNNWNNFQQDIGHIYPDVPFLIEKYFETVTKDPSHLPINHLGEVSASGAAVPAARQSRISTTSASTSRASSPAPRSMT